MTGTGGVLLVGVAAVCLPAVLPLLLVLGRQWLTLFLVPALGAVLIGLAAVVTVTLTVSLVASWAALAVLVNALTLLWWRRGGRPLERIAVDPGTLVAAVLGALASTAWAGNRALSWDVHSFWYSRGRWFLEGPGYVVQQLGSAYTSPYPGPPHAQYPPIPSATPGLMWQLTGGVDYFAAKLLLAGVTASTLVLLGLAVGRLVGSPRWLAWLAALLVPPATLYFATGSSAQGHQDLPYAAAGEAALIFGLLLARRRTELLVSVVLCVLCSLLKNEGFVVAVLVALLVSWRHAARDLRRFALLALPWLAAIGSWRVAMLRIGRAPDPTGVTQADELDRLRPLPSPGVTTLVHLFATHLWWFALPLLLGSVVVLLLARTQPGGVASLRTLGATLAYHAAIVVPLLGATGYVLKGGPGLPWAELLLRTGRYVTFSRLAMTVCLLVLAASALRLLRQPEHHGGKAPGAGPAHLPAEDRPAGVAAD